MRTHQEIDRRSLEMARRIVAKIDADPERRGFEHAKRVCQRWVEMGNAPAREWLALLAQPWDEVRRILLDESEEGQRLRQNDPFCGVLTPGERWNIYREASQRESPEEILVSREVDLYAVGDENASDLIDGSIGEKSPSSKSRTRIRPRLTSATEDQ